MSGIIAPWSTHGSGSSVIAPNAELDVTVRDSEVYLVNKSAITASKPVALSDRLNPFICFRLRVSCHAFMPNLMSFPAPLLISFPAPINFGDSACPLPQITVGQVGGA